MEMVTEGTSTDLMNECTTLINVQHLVRQHKMVGLLRHFFHQ